MTVIHSKQMMLDTMLRISTRIQISTWWLRSRAAKDASSSHHNNQNQMLRKAAKKKHRIMNRLPKDRVRILGAAGPSNSKSLNRYRGRWIMAASSNSIRWSYMQSPIFNMQVFIMIRSIKRQKALSRSPWNRSKPDQSTTFHLFEGTFLCMN